MRSWLMMTFIILLFAYADLSAQPPTLTPPQYRSRKPIPYTPLREADVMWAKRIWRTVDLREKFNHPLYYPEVKTQERISLFDVLKDALLATPPKLTAFANPALDDEFKIPMTPSEINALFIQWEPTQVENPNAPGTFINDTIKKELGPADVKQYWIKEDWFLDKQLSVMDARPLGICPLKEKVSETGEVLGYSPLFWIYFPEARQIFAKVPVYNIKNDAAMLSLDDVFRKRMYHSYIHKETNVFDRTINSYQTGLDILLESERIKEEIFRMEHDLWHF
ncbi:MAG: gliding motility associated protein GldN [Bacteroidetes bacterium]|nr:MAG: gliding motility associated protein GldN [Bacteroidota bacterium]